MFGDVGREEVQDHRGHIVAESGCDTPLVEGKSVLVSGKAQPFLDESSGGGHWIVGISPLECHGSFLVQLGVKEAGQNGDLWIGGVGGKWNGESLFGVLPLIWVEGRLAGQKAPPSHGGGGARVVVGLAKKGERVTQESGRHLPVCKRCELFSSGGKVGGEVSEVSSGDWLCKEVLAGRLKAGLESGGWFQVGRCGDAKVRRRRW